MDSVSPTVTTTKSTTTDAIGISKGSQPIQPTSTGKILIITVTEKNSSQIHRYYNMYTDISHTSVHNAFNVYNNMSLQLLHARLEAGHKFVKH